MIKKLTALALWLVLTAAGADEWDYPEDIPVAEPVTVGLAGEKPADIVRYLYARGARSASMAPDGTSIAFSYDVTGEPQLWLVDGDGGWPQQLTFGTGITGFDWAPDSKHLLVRRDAEGNEREGYYLLSRDGTRETQLLPLSSAFRAFGMFSEDGSQILYSSTERNGQDFDIYRHDLDTGETRMVYQGSFGFFPRAWQPGGSLVIVDEVRGEDAQDVHLLDVDTGRMTPLFQPEVAAAYADFAWLPDGSGFYLSTNVDREYSALAFYSLAERTLSIVDAPEADVENVCLSDRGRYLTWTRNVHGYSEAAGRDLIAGTGLEAPELPPGVHSTSCAREAPRVGIRINGPRTPGDVYVWNLADGDAVRAVESTLAGLDESTFVEPEHVYYAARDGLPLHGLLYLPDTKAFPGKPPLVVDVHGGPTGQSRPTFQPSTQYLVNNGIAVFYTNVRGSTGYGKTFARLDNREKRLDSVRDLADTVAFLSRDPRVDATRAAVMGGSYGGYMVNAVLGTYPGVFDAGVSRVGVSDWVRALQTASPGLKASDRIEYGDIREQEWQDFYARNSPINNADKIDVPLLIEHGANDPRDPVQESDRLVRTVRSNGGTVRYLRFPDEGHSIVKVTNRVTYYRAVAEFLSDILFAKDEPSD